MKKKKTTHICASLQAEGEQCFWVNEGPVLRNMSDLKNALKTMSREQFTHHTKKDGNDFAKWVGEILNCSECAMTLKKAKTKSGALRAVEQYC